MVKHKWGYLWRLSITTTVTVLVVSVAVYLGIGYGYQKGYNNGAKQAIEACQQGMPVCRTNSRT